MESSVFTTADLGAGANSLLTTGIYTYMLLYEEGGTLSDSSAAAGKRLFWGGRFFDNTTTFVSFPFLPVSLSRSLSLSLFDSNFLSLSPPHSNRSFHSFSLPSSFSRS